jgi:hypothetical protein
MAVRGLSSYNGGQVTASGGKSSYSILAERNLTINGGQVTATGTNGTGIETNNITINGGQVTATGGYRGIHSYGDITLSWTKADDFIKASSYHCYFKDDIVKITDGKILQYGNNGTKLYEGDITTLAEGGTLNHLKLTPYGIGGYCGSTENNADGKNLTWEIPLIDDDNNAETPKQLSTMLTIEGSGDMADYTITDAPWKGCNVSLIFVADETAYNAFAPKVNDTDRELMAAGTITLKKNADGWSTFCHNYPVAYSLSEGATAYTVSGVSSTNVNVTTTEGNMVDAGKPLLIGYSGTGDVTLTAMPDFAATPGSSVIVDNGGTNVIFYGNAGNTSLTASDLTNYIHLYGNTEGQQSYVLSGGKFIPVISTDGGIAPHRCWLNITTGTGNAPKMLSIGEAETTSLTPIDNEQLTIDNFWYDMQGRKLEKQPKTRASTSTKAKRK